MVTEILGPAQVEMVHDTADVLQIGARNAQNYDLLESVAQANKPVLLKRGMASTVEEWLAAAEYLLVNGCSNVMLCERGLRSFDKSVRNLLDLGGVAVAKQETHLPVLVDPSHAAGKRSLVLPLAKAALGAGADGLVIEAHPNPNEAYSDAAQQLPSATFKQTLDELAPWIALARASR
jgi:3-deoxy-7-phosphoheptulonate synthase